MHAGRVPSAATVLDCLNRSQSARTGSRDDLRKLHAHAASCISAGEHELARWCMRGMFYQFVVLQEPYLYSSRVDM